MVLVKSCHVHDKNENQKDVKPIAQSQQRYLLLDTFMDTVQFSVASFK